MENQRRCNNNKKIICCQSTVWGYDNMNSDNHQRENFKQTYSDEKEWDRGEYDCQKDYKPCKRYENSCDKEEDFKPKHRSCICKIFDCIFGGW